MKKILFLLLVITLASCNVDMYDKVYVKSVEDSEVSDYNYMVTLDGANGDVEYYTNEMLEVGDTLLSPSQLKAFNLNRIEYLEMESDSLKIENDELNKKIKELETYNQLLIEIVNSNK